MSTGRVEGVEPKGVLNAPATVPCSTTLQSEAELGQFLQEPHLQESDLQKTCLVEVESLTSLEGSTYPYMSSSNKAN